VSACAEQYDTPALMYITKQVTFAWGDLSHVLTCSHMSACLSPDLHVAFERLTSAYRPALRSI